jgi:hypothetical protein
VVKASCQQRLEELNRALPRIVFDVKDASGKDIPDVQLTVDGAVQVNVNAAVTLDPGDHEFRFEVTGQDPVVRHFVLRESEQDRREPIVIGGAVATAPPLPPPGPATTAPPQPPPGSATTPSEAASPMGTIGLVAGGVGVVGLIVGSIFGGLTISSSGSANNACPSHTGCSAQATNDRNNALTYGTVSTVAFIAGGGLVGGGLTLYFTAPKSRAPSVGVQMAPGRMAMTGRFW